MLRNVNFLAAVAVLVILVAIFQIADRKCDQSCGSHAVEQGHDAHGDAAESLEAPAEH